MTSNRSPSSGSSAGRPPFIQPPPQTQREASLSSSSASSSSNSGTEGFGSRTSTTHATPRAPQASDSDFRVIRPASSTSPEAAENDMPDQRIPSDATVIHRPGQQPQQESSRRRPFSFMITGAPRWTWVHWLVIALSAMAIFCSIVAIVLGVKGLDDKGGRKSGQDVATESASLSDGLFDGPVATGLPAGVVESNGRPRSVTMPTSTTAPSPPPDRDDSFTVTTNIPLTPLTPADTIDAVEKGSVGPLPPPLTPTLPPNPRATFPSRGSFTLGPSTTTNPEPTVAPQAAAFQRLGEGRAFFEHLREGTPLNARPDIPIIGAQRGPHGWTGEGSMGRREGAEAKLQGSAIEKNGVFAARDHALAEKKAKTGIVRRAAVANTMLRTKVSAKRMRV